MNEMLLAGMVVLTVLQGFAQGTVVFNNRVNGTVVARVYGAPAGQYLSLIGNGPDDYPIGTTDWSAFFLIGSPSNSFAASTTFAQLLGAPGFNQAESSLVPGYPATTFRTGSAAGFVAQVTETFNNIAPDAAAATIEMVVWDNRSGLYSDWTLASVAWMQGLVAAGKSATFNVSAIGGNVNTPPYLTGLQSFNVYGIPEPSTLALLSLGAAALMLRPRRK
jgi:hypothetical protein